MKLVKITLVVVLAALTSATFAQDLIRRTGGGGGGGGDNGGNVPLEACLAVANVPVVLPDVFALCPAQR